MRVRTILLVAFLTAAVISGAQSTRADRDFIIFENNGLVFASYLRAGMKLNYEGAMVEGGNPWNVVGGYNGMRFMNESNYNEWLLGYESDRENSSWWGAAYFRVAYDIPDFSRGWLEASNIILPEAFFRMGYSGRSWNLWIGRRYNDKVAIAMMDYYVANLDGNGGGVENIALGNASMDMHWLFSYDNDGNGVDQPDGDGNYNAFIGKQTLAMHFKDIAAGDHSLSFILAPSILPGNTIDGGPAYQTTGGAFFTMKYDRNCFFKLDGRSQTYASVGFGSGANQAADTNLDASGWEDWSVFAGFQGSGKVNETFSFMTTLHYEHRSYDAMTDFLSFGLRPMFKVAPIFGLQFEYDLEVAFTTGAMVNRLTFAPTFTPVGGDVTSAVQMMPYITWGYGDFQGGDTIAIGDTDHGLAFGIFGHVGF